MTAIGEPIPFVDLSAVHSHVEPALTDAFQRVLASSVFVGGPEVARFEEALAARVGTAAAVGVASGTAALHLALAAAGIGPGDEVVIPANTFFATAEAVGAAGAVPVAADVSPATALLDPASVEAVVTSRTAAIIAVHLFGQPADMSALTAIARRRSLLLVEDAAQAITGTWEGRPVGALADVAAFSFYPSKNLGALGDAGAVTTDDVALATRVAALRDHGQPQKHDHAFVGGNERLDSLQAAFLAVKLDQLDWIQALRLEAVDRYSARLGDVPEVTRFGTDKRAGHAHHLMAVQVPRRDAVRAALAKRGIAAEVHYPTPVHLQAAWPALGGAVASCPVAESLAGRILSLPLYAGMTAEQVDRCVQALGEAIDETAGTP